MSLEDAGRLRRRARYEGEDNSVTTPRELMGWYSYAVAAEVYAVCAVGSFLPITLEQLARERGVWFSDNSTPCVVKPSSGAQDAGDGVARFLFSRAEETKNEQCVVSPFGSPMSTASFALYTSSIAVLVQALSLISFSSFADHGPYRKKLLLSFAWTGATSIILFIFISPPVYLLAALLAVVGVTCLGSSFTLLNSFLPLLVSNHPHSQSNSEPIGLSREESEKVTADFQLSAKISSKGMGVGYAASVFVQLIGIGILVLFKDTTIATQSPSFLLRVVLCLVGIWWATFTIPTAFYLHARPGPPLSTVLSVRGTSTFRSLLAYISFAWGSIWRTFKTALKLKQVTIFLVAWFLVSDSIATVSGTAMLFAKTELHMEMVGLVILSIIATSSGILGAFAWPLISARLKLQTNHTIICCIVLMEIIPLYGLLGYVPFIRAWGVGGIQQAWEIYPLGFIHGFVMGGISSYCRSFFGFLVPPGSEAAFFALYAVTDKGSSAVGPAIVARIVDRAGTIRPSFWFLAVLVVLPAPLVWWVDVERGRRDAEAMAQKMGMESGGLVDEAEFELVGEEDEFEEWDSDEEGVSRKDQRGEDEIGGGERQEARGLLERET